MPSRFEPSLSLFITYCWRCYTYLACSVFLVTKLMLKLAKFCNAACPFHGSPGTGLLSHLILQCQDVQLLMGICTYASTPTALCWTTWWDLQTQAPCSLVWHKERWANFKGYISPALLCGLLPICEFVYMCMCERERVYVCTYVQ